MNIANAPCGDTLRYISDRLHKIWLDWRGFVMFVAVMLVFRSVIADWNQVPSGSMKPSILDGDRIIVDKLAYDLRVPFTLTRIAQWSEPQRGDVITFPSPADERLFVKRVIGLPDDTVELRRNQLIINGTKARYEPLSDTKIASLPIANPGRFHFFRETVLGTSQIIMILGSTQRRGYSSFKPVVVPEGHYLVLGDNRDNSGDYRVIGPVARERVLGRAHSIAFSINYDNYYAPRLSRFFTNLR
jgi:signal peptidase I